MTQATDQLESSTKDETQALLVKVFNKLLTLEEYVNVEFKAIKADINDLREEIQEVKTEVQQVKAEVQQVKTEVQQVKATQEEVNKKVSTWDSRLWGLSLILVGSAVAALVTVTVAVANVTFGGL